MISKMEALLDPAARKFWNPPLRLLTPVDPLLLPDIP
jgi:hypothetical protein